MRKTVLRVTGVALAAAGLAGAGAAAQQQGEALPAPSAACGLAACAERAWEVSWSRFYLPRTHLFYDYLTSCEPGKELVHLPAAAEVARQVPNECGYGTGMEGGMISAGVMLSLIVDRYEVTKEASLRARAYDVFQGVRLCATAHGVTGFLARAVCHEDIRSIYPNSSRDQYTHAVHGLWHYARSPLCAPATKAAVGAMLFAIADRMKRNVTPENNYDSLRSDGSRDTRGISRMRDVMGHEAALTQLMDPETPYSEEQKALLARAITRLDYDRVSSGGIFYLQAAYWKARRRGVVVSGAQ